jgi:nucleoid-associated protein YgaU
MQAQSRTLLFGVSTVLAVGAVAFLAWRAMEQTPLLFGAASPPAIAPQQNKPEPSRAETAKSIPATFDVVSVEPDGSTVVAGRAEPGAQVQLLNNGVVVATVTADMNGQFAIVPPALTAGEHLLSLATGGKPAERAQTVAVAVPKDRMGEPVVALTEPGVPTRILSDHAPKAPLRPTQDAPAVSASIPQPAPNLSIRAVEADEAGGFYASGAGAPGAQIRLSLNGTPLAQVQAGADGGWSLKIEKGMAAGAYAVKADLLDATGKVLAQAEVPFDYPARPLGQAQGQAKGQAAASASHAVLSEVQSVTVQRGDSLWRISQRLLGSGYRYTQIYAANSNQIRDPSLIYPYQILVVPGGARPN